MAKAILIDGNSLMYRAYYATNYGNIMRSEKGLATNCIYAFYKMIKKLKIENYDYALIAFDYGKKTLRHEKLESYKGGRSPMPDELREQVPFVKKLSAILGLKVYEQELVEADDIVGTMARKLNEIDVTCDIFSGDKDLLQLVNEKNKVFLTKKGVSDLVEYNIDNFKELTEIYPNQVIDLKGLMGDTSDNLKGIQGIGSKTAIKLLNEYNTLEEVINNSSKLTKKMQENIERDKEQALLCKEIATINKYSEISVDPSDVLYKGVMNQDLYELFKELEFNSLISEIKVEKKELDFVVLDENNLHLLNGLDDSYFAIEYYGSNYHKAEILALAVTKDKTYVVDKKYFNNEEVKMYLKEARKITYDLKASYVIMHQFGIEVSNVNYDLMLLAYIIDADTKDNLFDLCLKYNVTLPNEQDIYGKGVKKAIPSCDIYYEYAARKGEALAELNTILQRQITKEIADLHSLELSLAYTLARMEIRGVHVDLKVLNELKSTYQTRLDYLTSEIYLEGGVEFNINSPKQLGDVLFEQLGLPYPKKKKDSYSTSSDILEKLNGFRIVDLVLEYRKLAKLVSTYLDGMENVLINGRVHTIYKQALTTTGRLSSTDPNMQNIPIRSEEGRNIRKIFTTDKTFIGLDYSQIELRVLAHLSGDEAMIEAFKNGEDIHRLTAAKVYKKSIDEVTREERSIAKAVNFGIIYGQSSYGLSEELKISLASAKEFIDEYYEHYPKVKGYLDNLANLAKEKGYAETMFHRRRYLNDLNSKNYFLREFAVRTSINTPIQGTAADIIKIAMVNLDRALKERKLKSAIVLQIHDELIIEVEKNELEEVSKLAKDMMENAVSLSVPLIADYNEADNLYDLK